MTTKEYREKHRHCKYCSRSEFGLYNYYCHAKEKDLLRNHAKRCPLYDVKGGVTDTNVGSKTKGGA